MRDHIRVRAAARSTSVQVGSGVFYCLLHISVSQYADVHNSWLMWQLKIFVGLFCTGGEWVGVQSTKLATHL